MLDGLSKAFCFISILPVPLISSLQKKMHAFMMWGAGVYMEAREQLSGAEFLPSIIWAGRVNSGGQSLWQVPLTTEPSYCALTSIHFCFAVTPVFFSPSPSKPPPSFLSLSCSLCCASFSHPCVSSQGNGPCRRLAVLLTSHLHTDVLESQPDPRGP